MSAQSTRKPTPAMPWCVYTLTDPRTNEVRYVGWTTNLPRRFREHLSEGRRRHSQSRKHTWISGVIADGFLPIATVVEEGMGPEWEAVERKWIAAYRALGCELTNETSGGNGMLGRVIAPETRKKISATKRARGIPPESRERIIAGSRGKKYSPERVKKAADARRGWKQTPEAREKIGAFNRGRKQSPEHIAKTIAGRKAKGGWKVSQRGRPQRCGICREPGHKRATCPQRDKE
jgi:hypothetical protein